MITRSRLRVVQRVLGTVGILIALSAVAAMLVPFRILEIQCGPAITGSKVEIGGPRGSLVQDHEAPICHKKGSSRLINAGIVLVLGAGLGYAGWFLPLGPAWLVEEEEGAPDRSAASGKDWSAPAYAKSWVAVQGRSAGDSVPSSKEPSLGSPRPTRSPSQRSGPSPPRGAGKTARPAPKPARPAPPPAKRSVSQRVGPATAPAQSSDAEPTATPVEAPARSSTGGRQIPPIPQGGDARRGRGR